MDAITQKSINLKNFVSKFSTESFAGFFAYFIRQGSPFGNGSAIDQFKSKLKDILYLIALNAFSENKSDNSFELDNQLVEKLTKDVEEIKIAYESVQEYSLNYLLHTMAFQNYFHNGTLSYVQQDIEKIRRVFSHFDVAIEENFGFDVETAIEIYKQTELIFKIRFEGMTAYSKTIEFKQFLEDLNDKKYSFEEGLNKLPQEVQESFLQFSGNSYASFLFTNEDLYLSFEKEKVDAFLKLFSCTPSPRNFLYYTDPNPLEEAPILRIGDNKYLHIHQRQIVIAIYNRFHSFLMKEEKYFDKIRKHRDNELEKKVLEIFTDFFKKDFHIYKNYYVVNKHEQDLLLTWKGLAFIIEIKASKMREPLRDVEKAIVKIKDDFKKSIQYGYKQCKRVEDLFKEGEPFSILNSDNKILHTVNPKKYHAVFSIIVTLERWGALQSNLDLLLEKEKKDNFPWAVYIDDLEITLMAFKKLFRNQIGNFVSFLKERRKLHGRSYTIDELDICAEYLMDTPKFIKNANQTEGFVMYSPKNQNYFDELYNHGLLNFKEAVLLNTFKKIKIEQ
jgi:hypothetical protein